MALSGTSPETLTMKGMQKATTIDIAGTPMPQDPNERSLHQSELLRALGGIRKIKICKETFRRWRQAAKITNKTWYSQHDLNRLGIVARHMFAGGEFDDKLLNYKIRKYIRKEKEVDES